MDNKLNGLESKHNVITSQYKEKYSKVESADKEAEAMINQINRKLAEVTNIRNKLIWTTVIMAIVAIIAYVIRISI